MTGAEMFCDLPENFSAYESIQGPSAEDREEFQVPEDTESVDGRTKCSGGHPGEPDVDRTALIRYPDEDQAAIHVRAERFNTR